MTHPTSLARRLAPWAVALLATACGGGGGGISGTGAQMGTLKLALTDAPACGFDAVNVTIEKVRVHQNAGVDDENDAGWIDVPVSDVKRVDLLSLTNGVLDELGQTSLPAGKYTQLRLVLADNQSQPLANSVVPSGGAETALRTPGGQQSGLKINVDIDVAEGQTADFVLDFDACKSVVTAGSSGRYNLKPVLTAVPRLSDAGMRVIGYVDEAIATSGTTVSLQSNGVVVKATPPIVADGPNKGQFVLYPVPAGNYDLVVSAAGRVTAVMTGVPVVTDAFTHVNSEALRIDPPTSTERNASGSITPHDGTVRALQGLTGGPAIEVAWGSVDADTGEFGFTLPVGAPVKTSYVANPTALDFQADAAVAARYTIEAAAGGVMTTQAADLRSADATGLDFVFP